ncbi:MAG: MaoC family dehydratase N-terminal domain-containing protein, partial [Solirubrobacteraceae bacterium]
TRRPRGTHGGAPVDRPIDSAPMPLDTSAMGKSYEPSTYAVGREKVREYAYAVGETNALHLDPGAARSASFADVVAPPMFAVVYAGRAMAPAILDPEVGMNFARMVHGGQEFRWGPLVVAGDEIITTASVKDIAQRGGMGFYVFETVSVNQDGETVCTGTWTNIVRGD